MHIFLAQWVVYGCNNHDEMIAIKWSRISSQNVLQYIHEQFLAWGCKEDSWPHCLSCFETGVSGPMREQITLFGLVETGVTDQWRSRLQQPGPMKGQTTNFEKLLIIKPQHCVCEYTDINLNWLEKILRHMFPIMHYSPCLSWRRRGVKICTKQHPILDTNNDDTLWMVQKICQNPTFSKSVKLTVSPEFIRVRSQTYKKRPNQMPEIVWFLVNDTLFK